MRELEIIGIRMDEISGNTALLLQEFGGTRVLPIWVGHGEAAAIMAAQEESAPPRPMTHDLLVSVLDGFGKQMTGVTITKMVDGVFFAELEIEDKIFDCRPSDGVALAIRTGAPVQCANALLDQVGVESSPPDEDEMEQFKEFLDQVSPDDFWNQTP